MKLQQLSVHFTDTAAEEVNNLVADLRLVPIAESLRTQKQLPVEFQEHMQALLSVLMDLFSTDLPDISRDPEIALRTVSRDINLSRLLKERGLFRLYRLLHCTDTNGLPSYMGTVNPNTGSPFAKQEEFIGWFCEEAHVTRSIVFMRLAAIDRLLTLGFDLDEAFNIIVSKPSVIQDVLRMVADWDKGELTGVDPQKLLRITNRLAPASVPEIESLAQAALDNPDDTDIQEALRTAAKPIIAGLMEEVADHDRAKDAANWVKHDLLLQPDVRYSFDQQSGVLMIELIKRQIDTVTGEEYDAPPVVIPFVPDATKVPVEIWQDLLRRLPVRNKAAISLDR